MTEMAWRQGDQSRMEESGGTMNASTQSTKIHVQHEPISIQDVTLWASQPEAGAVSSFLGITRNNFNNKKVIRLEYEGYVPMAEKVLQSIAAQIFTKWTSTCRVAIIHRLGVVPVSEASVLIVVSSPHRLDSLLAVHYAIDQVKALVPIWKKEVYDTGETITTTGEDIKKTVLKEDLPTWKTNKEWNATEAAAYSAKAM